MAFYADEVLDAALAVFRGAVSPVLHVCGSEPVDYAAAVAASLGNKAAPTITAQADRTGGGRKVEVSAFTDGTVTASGTATHWALVDANDSRLLATVAVPASQALTSGNALSMTSALVLGIADAV